MVELKGFESDFIEMHSQAEFNEVNALIEKAFDSDGSCFIDGDLWCLSLDVEKENSLQYIYHMSLSKEIEDRDDVEVNISFENGINNGTQLMDYSFDGESLTSSTKTAEILCDLSVDWNWYDRHLPGVNKVRVKLMLKHHKADILDIYSKENYDNYVTGGGTTGTKSHYKSKFEKYNDMKLHWVCEYERMEVDRNFV